ncbi:MAG: PilZ domain-containing protein [Terriglobales bacterium]
MAEPAPVPRKYRRPRRWARYNVDVPVRVLTQRPANNEIANGHGTQLNGGGMRLLVLLDLRIGDQIAIEFTPPYSGRLVTVRAFVRNRRSHTYGVEFITENDADYAGVQQLESVLNQMITPMR